MQEPDGIERCQVCGEATWRGRGLCDGCLIAELEKELAEAKAENVILRDELMLQEPSLAEAEAEIALMQANLDANTNMRRTK